MRLISARRKEAFLDLLSDVGVRGVAGEEGSNACAAVVRTSEDARDTHEMERTSEVPRGSVSRFKAPLLRCTNRLPLSETDATFSGPSDSKGFHVRLDERLCAWKHVVDVKIGRIARGNGINFCRNIPIRRPLVHGAEMKNLGGHAWRHVRHVQM
eukprot:2356402-Prymnesium_polylepis.1